MSYLGSVSAQGNGNSSSVILRGGFVYQARIGGTFDGATVTIQIYDDTIAEWVPATDGVTSADVVNIETPSGTDARVNVASGGGSESINVNFVLLRNH